MPQSSDDRVNPRIAPLTMNLSQLHPASHPVGKGLMADATMVKVSTPTTCS